MIPTVVAHVHDGVDSTRPAVLLEVAHVVEASVAHVAVDGEPRHAGAVGRAEAERRGPGRPRGSAADLVAVLLARQEVGEPDEAHGVVAGRVRLVAVLARAELLVAEVLRAERNATV